MTQESSETLLPCPFCGEQPGITPDDSYGGCHVMCNCEHEPSIHLVKSQLEEAKRRWNRRALQQPASGYVMVPREPTQKMLAELSRPNHSFVVRYQRLLAVAPQPSPVLTQDESDAERLIR